MSKHHETPSPTQISTILNEVSMAVAKAMQKIPFTGLLKSFYHQSEKLSRFLGIVLKAMYYHQYIQIVAGPIYWWEEEGIVFLKILTTRLFDGNWTRLVERNQMKIDNGLVWSVVSKMKPIWQEQKWITVGIIRSSLLKENFTEKDIYSTANHLGWIEPPPELAFLIAGSLRIPEDSQYDLKENSEMRINDLIVMHKPLEGQVPNRSEMIRLGIHLSSLSCYRVGLTRDRNQIEDSNGFAFIVPERNT